MNDKTCIDIEKYRSGILSNCNAMLIVSLYIDTTKTQLKLLCRSNSIAQLNEIGKKNVVNHY